MPINNGVFLERLVEVIEQSISPDSTIERNVYLPILASKSSRTAQCDIVIRTGKPPRQTITIVEVQDRNKAVNINEFRGWVKKLEDVGAQHLYCVSRKPFPESIKEQAMLSGNTVKLITLKRLDESQIPINFFKTTFLYNDVDVPHIRKIETIFPILQAISDQSKLEKINADLALLKTNDQKFSFDKIRFKALSTICIEHNSPYLEVTQKTDILDLGYDDIRPLYFYSYGEFVQIRLRIEYIWASKTVEIPISILSYDQGDDGTLAWILESFYQSSRGPIWFKIPVTKDGDVFLISGMIVSMPNDMEFSFNIKKESPQERR